MEVMTSFVYVVPQRKKACGVSLTAIPMVIQCAVYLSQVEVDTLEKGDKAGGVIASRLIFL